MLTLSSKTKPRPVRGPARETLAVVWLHGRVAVACGRSGRTWTTLEPAADPDALGAALLEAMAALQPTAKTVILAVAHHRLRHQHLNLPPLRAGSRRRYLERQVFRIPGTEEPQCWSHRTAVPVSAPEAVLLSLIPGSIHDSLAAACRRAGLVLQQLVPFSELLLASAATAAAREPGDGFQFVAARLAGRIEMAVADAGGRAVLARCSGPDPAEAPSDGGREVLRTAQFLQQTHAAALRGFHWLGPGPGPAMPATMQTCDESWTPRSWAEQLLTLDPRTTVNLVSRDQREASGRRWVQASHRALSMLGVLGAAAYLIVADQGARHHTLAQHRLRTEVVRMAAREQSLRQAITEAGDQQQRAAFLAVTKPPMPLWLLAGLTEVVPRSCQVTEFEARWDAGRWRHRIAGRDREGGGLPASLIPGMTSILAGAPFFANTALLEPAATNAPSTTNWTQRIRSLLAAPGTPPTTFLLEGHVE